MERIAGGANPCLEIRDLRVALAVASAGSTSRAASLLHLTQPAVSRALLSVEEKLGTKLFERTPRGLSPTPAGERLLGEAPRLLVDLCELERRVRGEPRTTTLRVVCECYTAYHWLPSALPALKASLPDVSLELSVEHAGDPVAALEDGTVDIAMLTAAQVRGPVEETELFSDEIVFVLAKTHPLAAKSALSPQDLKSVNLLSSSRVSPGESSWFLSSVFGRARPRLRVERLPLTEAIIDLTRAGLGVAILSKWIAAPQLKSGDLVAKRLTTGPLLRPWRLAWQRRHRDAAMRLGAALATTAP